MPVKLKKGSKAAKDYMAKIRAMRGTGTKHTDTKSHNVNVRVVSGTKKESAYRQTGTSVKSKDKQRTALAPGKRTTGKGKSKHTYYERRANRSDKPGQLLGIGAVKSDLSSKYKKVVNNIAFLSMEIDIQKAIKKHAKNKLLHTNKIKNLQKQLSEQKKLKTKLSRFK